MSGIQRLTRISRRGIILIVLILLVVVIGYFFVQYRSNILDLPIYTAPFKVEILDPPSGTEAPVNMALLVEASVHAENPIQSVELWANGSIVGVQSVSPGEPTTAVIGFSWVPSEAGTYALIARARDAEEKTADSSAVTLLIGPSDKSAQDDASEDPGGYVPIAGGSGGEGAPSGYGPPESLPSQPTSPNGDDSIGPAEPWKGSLGNWITQILYGGPPTAPELDGEVLDCGVLLNIHDVSTNEEGFFLYRQTANAPGWKRIGTLAAQSQFDWITYTDQGFNGLISYYVAAFNGQNESPSNIVTFNINPETCPPAENEHVALSIEVTNLSTESGAEQVYCYKSLDGTNWSRWPKTGFFEPGVEGFEIETAVEKILMDETDPQAISLHLECWGWVGGDLQKLGEFLADDLNPEKTDSLAFGDSLLSAAFQVNEVPVTQMSGEGATKPATDPKMPRVFAIILPGVQTCLDHTPSGGDNFWENLFYCIWYPEYHDYDQPYLAWFVMETCLDGWGDDCNSLDYYLYRAANNGGEVGFNIYSQYSDIYPMQTTESGLTAWPIAPPQNGCGSDTKFLNVRMYYTGGAEDPDYPNTTVEGMESNTVNTQPFCPTPDEVELEVTFDSIVIGDLGDGIGGGDDLEIYGEFNAGGSPGYGTSLHLRPWGDHGECPDDNVEWLGSMSMLGTMDCPQIVTEGSASISTFDLLCSSSYPGFCSVSGYQTQNNKARITVEGGGSIHVAVHIWDWDHQSGDDPVCNAEMWIGPESIFGWMGYKTSAHLHQGDNDNASCDVYFRIEPVAEEQGG